MPLITLLLVLVSHVLFLFGAEAKCPPENFTSVDNFDLEKYISKKWYVQQQMECGLEPSDLFQCQYAEYKKMEKANLWGFDIQGHDHIDMPDGSKKDLYPCAKVIDESRGQWLVGECFLPSIMSGPYWVLAYDEEAGYAAVSGGAPSISFPGGCRVGTGHIKSGLWIFTRKPKRNEKIVNKVRSILKAKGFDLSALEDVDQTHCPTTTDVDENYDLLNSIRPITT
eukprot:CAMPEP_0204875920 /NCGR_PEP_ID=MMETSP1348-20121228/47250_1 /ASSEMBLY_ACC=CAM_ASM_000700 /TAXON_ID=215587 /ORGANISM="Aplanochytrium stocchinoi, Strain GSBS06" /LENGTH=224 /DNA_ID=CAMNT_0052032599 /DNA_START=156 /DNA_END=830 /DNA_ORIENTATION=+